MSDRWDQFGQDYDHQHFEGTPRTYLIASSPRSGSHFLGHLLFGTGALGSPLEYLHPVHAKKWMDLLGTQDFRTMMMGLYRRRTSPSGWFGIKAHWPHYGQIAANEGVMRFLGVERYIQIRRRDRVAQAISGVIAQQTQAWISFHEAHGEPRYDFGMIRRAVDALEAQVGKWDDFFRSRAIEPIRIDYEELVDRPLDFVEQILTAFEVCRSQVAEPKWLPQRQASDINLRWQERYLHDLETQSA